MSVLPLGLMSHKFTWKVCRLAAKGYQNQVPAYKRCACGQLTIEVWTKQICLPHEEYVADHRCVITCVFAKCEIDLNVT